MRTGKIIASWLCVTLYTNRMRGISSERISLYMLWLCTMLVSMLSTTPVSRQHRDSSDGNGLRRRKCLETSTRHTARNGRKQRHIEAAHRIACNSRILLQMRTVRESRENDEQTAGSGVVPWNRFRWRLRASCMKYAPHHKQTIYLNGFIVVPLSCLFPDKHTQFAIYVEMRWASRVRWLRAYMHFICRRTVNHNHGWLITFADWQTGAEYF